MIKHQLEKKIFDRQINHATVNFSGLSKIDGRVEVSLDFSIGMSDCNDFLKELEILVRRYSLPLEKDCEHCEGSGKVIIDAHQKAGDIVDEENYNCTACNGTGKVL